MKAQLASLTLVFAFAPSALAAPTPLWRSEFEKGFPGEFTNYNDCTYTPSGVPNANATSAWTIVNAPAAVGSISGPKLYKGWILGAETDKGCTQDLSHRPYPLLTGDFPSPLMNTFWVWVDVDWAQLTAPLTDWHHLGTWGPNTFWDVHTLTIFRRKLNVVHLKTFSYVGPAPQPDFPMRKWVKMGVYLHYKGATLGDIAVWQDGVLMFRGTIDKPGGTSLRQTHWGLYANGGSNHGTQYNDDIQLWQLDAPLTSFTTEPVSPYPPPGNGTDGGTSGLDAGTSGADAGPGPSDAGTGVADGGTSGEDGGTVDAGTLAERDAGLPGPLAPAQGCGCGASRSSGAGLGLSGLLLALGWMSWRPRRRGR